MTQSIKLDTEPNRLVETARRVLALEAKALTRFAETLDPDSFARAAAIMLSTRGRIVVSGMGKSGHVARKVAATLASTGTPAQFVHPAEAGHGDLGMIAPEDVVLLLSNSGETAELAAILTYTRRFGIPVIGVASRANSTLMQQADIGLLLPVFEEACPNGLAPTTSTTLTLALGDALAVALMEVRRFSSENFRTFHPGGYLGAQLILVRDVMHQKDEMPLIDPDTPMSEALIVMSEKGFGVAGIVENGRLSGIITDGDLRRNLDGLMDRRAGDVMTKSPRTVSPNILASEALGIMNTNQPRVTTLFAVNNETGAPEGIINVHDLLRAGIR